MMTIKRLLLAALLPAATFLLPACDSHDDEDKTQNVDRNGSVETSVSVQHADSTHDVILTTHKVWLHASEYSTLVHRDTIPALDSLNTEGEDSAGDTHQVRVKKDYQIFITVK